MLHLPPSLHCPNPSAADSSRMADAASRTKPPQSRTPPAIGIVIPPHFQAMPTASTKVTFPHRSPNTFMALLRKKSKNTVLFAPLFTCGLGLVKLVLGLCALLNALLLCLPGIDSLNLSLVASFANS